MHATKRTHYCKKRKPAKMVKHHASVKRVTAITAQFTSNSEPMTLNERILEAGPSSFFSSEQNSDADDSIVTKLISFVRCTIYAFIGLPS